MVNTLSGISTQESNNDNQELQNNNCANVEESRGNFNTSVRLSSLFAGCRIIYI